MLTALRMISVEGDEVETAEDEELKAIKVLCVTNCPQT